MFFCDPWASYMRQIEAESAEEMRRTEREFDREHEEELRLKHIEALRDGDEPELAWPWYADPIVEVQRPQRFRR